MGDERVRDLVADIATGHDLTCQVERHTPGSGRPLARFLRQFRQGGVAGRVDATLVVRAGGQVVPAWIPRVRADCFEQAGCRPPGRPIGSAEAPEAADRASELTLRDLKTMQQS
ncbi:hypothetical protein ACWCPI_38165 [Streptomyces sp. NPDC001920]